MKISEILNESHNIDSSLVSLTIISRKLDIFVKQMLAEIMEVQDQSELLPLASKIANWVNTNYKSSRFINGEGIESLLYTMMKSPKYKAAAQSGVDDIKFNMNTSELKGYKQKDKQSTFVKLDVIISTISRLLDIAGIQNSGRDTKKNFIEFRDIFSEILKGEQVPTQKTEPKKVDKSSIISQHQAAEDMVNKILNDLPSDVASKIRHEISKSDNKLRALTAILQSMK